MAHIITYDYLSEFEPKVLIAADSEAHKKLEVQIVVFEPVNIVYLLSINGDIVFETNNLHKAIVEYNSYL